MSKFLTFLIVLLLLAVVQTVAVVLGSGLLLALLYSFATRPGETLLYLAGLALLGLASAQPIALIIALGVVGLAVVWARSRRRWGSSRFADDVRARHRRTLRLDRDVYR